MSDIHRVLTKIKKAARASTPVDLTARETEVLHKYLRHVEEKK